MRATLRKMVGSLSRIRLKKEKKARKTKREKTKKIKELGLEVAQFLTCGSL